MCTDCLSTLMKTSMGRRGSLPISCNECRRPLEPELFLDWIERT